MLEADWQAVADRSLKKKGRHRSG